MLKDRVLTLTTAQRENLKFHGLEQDSQESNADLISCMGRWLASELGTEPQIFPVLTKAYCMGTF